MILALLVGALFHGIEIPMEMYLMVMAPLMVMIMTKYEYGKFSLTIPGSPEEEENTP
jgi:hypothetical protein